MNVDNVVFTIPGPGISFDEKIVDNGDDVKDDFREIVVDDPEVDFVVIDVVENDADSDVKGGDNTASEVDNSNPVNGYLDLSKSN